MSEVRVTVRCVGCRATQTVVPGDVPEFEMPLCNACLLPMVAESAVATEHVTEGHE